MSWSDGNMDMGFYPGSGPLDGGETLRPAFDCIHMGCSTEYMYLPRDDSNEYEIVD